MATPFLILLCALLAVLLLANEAACATATPSPTGDYVILLHGLGRTSVSMKRLEIHLRRAGYQVLNASYPSTRFCLRELADIYLDARLRAITNPTAKINFVTHSMGGILLRQYLSNHDIKNLGRVVMIAPPNHGSEIIDRLKTIRPPARMVLGPAALELGTTPDDLPNRLGPVNFECGVIAGDRPTRWPLAAFLPRPNDGTVSVASAELPGMKDFIVLHNSHTWIIWRKETLRQTLSFLGSGKFSPRKQDLRINRRLASNHA
jgi:pimeloyl-ACP methyl ester carboxylesterase